MEFKIGDFIRVKSKTYFCEKVKIGDTATIIQKTEIHYVLQFKGFEQVVGIDDAIKFIEKCDEFKVIFQGNETILFKDGKKYVAKCEMGDTYDKEKGLLVCLAKANGISFNDLKKMIDNAEYNIEIKKNTNKETERPAKVGEYIKITNARYTDDCYFNWEIYKVIEVFKNNGVYINTKKTHGCCKGTHRQGQSFVKDEEYVVLENYQQQEKLVKTKFKDKFGNKLFMGDTVRITSKSSKLSSTEKVVERFVSYIGKTKQFIDGIESRCNDKTGKISGWIVEKIIGDKE